MALILTLLQKQYFQGQVKFFRGDQWELLLQAINKVGNVSEEVDLTGGSITAWFPAASGGAIGVIASLVKEDCGIFKASVAPDVSAQVQLNDSGIYLFATIEDAPGLGGPVSIQTPNQDFIIADRNTFGGA